MKKLVNNPNSVVEEMIEGLVTIYPHLSKLAKQNVLVRSDCRDPAVLKKVALISGGGSGHEPAHAGYIGKGMLSAAVLGNVFSSPTINQILSAIRTVTGSGGCLLIVKNYTGDRLNFGIAAEIARNEGFKVEMVIVADDCALLSQLSENAGRRGIAGTILVHKIAGACAELGLPLEHVTSIARTVAENVITMGIGLSPCTIPAVGKPTFTLESDEVELGLGIHGEVGLKRVKLQSVDSHVDELLENIFNVYQSQHKLDAIKDIVMLINNLGSTTAMEMAIVSRRAAIVASTNGYRIQRIYCGSFMTALEMAGCSISILPVNEELLKCLDFETKAPAWIHTMAQPNLSNNEIPYAYHSKGEEVEAPNSSDKMYKTLHGILKITLNELILQSKYLTELDSFVGDGDMGLNVEKACKSILSKLDSLCLNNPGVAFYQLAMLQEELGGTSGPLYTVFFLRASKVLKDKGFNDVGQWLQAFQEGANGICELGNSKEGDRTMLDSLIPSLKAFQEAIKQQLPLLEALEKAAIAAETGAKNTSAMERARRGRASNLGTRVLGYIDPGAQCIAFIVRSIHLAMSQSK